VAALMPGRGKEFFVNTGEKLRLKKVVRSQKTGMLLPKEGTLVYITENFGRRLLLVAFEAETVNTFLMTKSRPPPVSLAVRGNILTFVS
jgi:hypothetical protein